MDFLSTIKSVFQIDRIYQNAEVDQMVAACANAYKGMPLWAATDGTVNFTKTVCEETARLIMLGTSVKFNDSARGEYLQKVIDSQYYNLRMWAEWAMAYGTVIIKPNGEEFDCVLPEAFFVTDVKNGEIWGAVFVTSQKSGDEWYTRFEWHRFEKDVYKVSNRTFVGNSENSAEKQVPIETTVWSDLSPDVEFEGLDAPLFAVLRTPQANNIDEKCPYALPLAASAIVEMQDLDIAYNRFAVEIADSSRTVLMDSDRLIAQGMTAEQRKSAISAYGQVRDAMGLPKYVKAVEGMGDGNFYSEINPTLNTQTRLQGINHILSQIGYKIGFANGYFVFNEASGIQTATGVEANQQRTMQFIKDCRDRMEEALGKLIKGINVFADTYDLAPEGTYEVTYQFGDITYNEDEDRARWLTYVNMGKMPFWRYLVKFEGYTEEDAKAIEAETVAANMLMAMPTEE